MQRGPFNRRRILAAGGALAGAFALPGAGAADVPRSESRPDAHARAILFQGGTVVTGDERAGVAPQHQDVLVRGDRIEAIGPNLPVSTSRAHSWSPAGFGPQTDV